MAQKLAPFDKNGALDMSATSAAFLAPTGALLVTMVYYISIQPTFSDLHSVS